MSSKCVQGTNDSSIVSKASAAERGYFSDPFLKLMVHKRARRAPLINRGYYIRMKAVDESLRHFISVTSDSGGPRYIISLGAGFDTAYFRLKSNGLLNGVVFIEVDFYDVALNKAKLIQQSSQLSDVLGSYDVHLSSNILLRSPDYYLVASDLNHEAVLDACLRELIPDWEAPVLFLSECVLTYVTPKNTARLIDWIRQGFPCCVFFLYEQIKPYDSFGIIMCQHFKSLGSPLRCIETYSQLSDQRKRFSVGWQLAEALDMNQFYYDCLDARERSRVEGLEVFDEYEEWASKCAHYFVLAAQSAGFYHRHQRASFFPAAAAAAAADAAARDTSGNNSWTLDYGLDARPAGALTRVRARPLPGGGGSVAEQPFRLHWAALCALPPPEATGSNRPPGQLLVRLGGYGRDPLAGVPGHRRLSCLTLLEPYGCGGAEPRHVAPLGCPPGAEWLEHWLGPLACAVGPTELLVFGGKASPLRATARLLLVRLVAGAAESATDSATISEVAQRAAAAKDADGEDSESAAAAAGSSVPCARWRHAGCYVNCPAPALVVYGGRTPDCLCLADAFLGRLERSEGDNDGATMVTTVAWEALPSTPGPRCSAAMCSHPGDLPLCFLSGGLTLDDASSMRDADAAASSQQPSRLLRPVWDLWQLDLSARQWTRLPLTPRLSGQPGLSVPRFGHSMHCLPAFGDAASASSAASCFLVCFGGVPVSPDLRDSASLVVLRLKGVAAEFVNLGVDFGDCSPGQQQAFLDFNAATAVVAPTAVACEESQQQKQPLLVIVGGGGSCFSFGTHFNGPAACLSLPEILLPVAALFCD